MLGQCLRTSPVTSGVALWCHTSAAWVSIDCSHAGDYATLRPTATAVHGGRINRIVGGQCAMHPTRTCPARRNATTHRFDFCRRARYGGAESIGWTNVHGRVPSRVWDKLECRGLGQASDTFRQPIRWTTEHGVVTASCTAMLPHRERSVDVFPQSR